MESVERWMVVRPAVIPVQVHIGFGDAVTPAAQEQEFPSLLSAEGPRLRAYPRETVVAEKLQAIVALGHALRWSAFIRGKLYRFPDLNPGDRVEQHGVDRFDYARSPRHKKSRARGPAFSCRGFERLRTSCRPRR
ncbi:nucleotidyl transferase AbiEii/AbiGii toxin family protein [Mesorhizobium ciceri]|uniref:nucleotidyl transferase AbiEii/AbiGii toxin family protein n=2 Tax=Mesorhizobium TaxID=68287 RepID=UPI0012DE4B0F